MRLARAAATLLAAAALAAAAPAPRRVAVVLDSSDADQRAVYERLARDLASEAEVARYELGESDYSDPIAKGRVLADLQSRDLVVPVGDEAARFVTGELEDARVYFVGVRQLPGEALRSPEVRGMFSYNADALLDAAKALRFSRLGLAYTPGYGPVADWFRRGAAERGLALVERRVDGPRGVASAARELLARSRAIVVAGDPLLVRGAGFEYLREGALARAVPLILQGPWGVRHGGLLVYEPPVNGLADEAAAAVGDVLAGRDGARFRPAPPGGTIVMNGALAGRWGLSPPPGERWKIVR